MNSSTENGNQKLTPAMVDKARIARITRQLYERQQCAFLLVDHEWTVIETSSNFDNYGFGDLPIGSDARESIEFLVGLDSHSSLDLPIVLSPSNHPINIVLLPEEETLTVALIDATRDYEQQQVVQQKANENELLLAQQTSLTKDLELTQAALLKRNEELKEAARLQSSFLSGVSHEFRTPLTALIGYVELLSDRYETQAAEQSYDQLRVIRRSARHLLSLVENLLDHGKLDSEEKMVLNVNVFDVQALCDEVEAMLRPTANNKNIDLRFQAHALPNCLIDDSRLRQILLNIVGNAIKFTDKGYVQVTVEWADDVLKIIVFDTGIGISAEDLEKVFHPFWQAPLSGRVGTGLGLTITQRIIDMMGGTLAVQSQLDVGTRVLVDLPAPQVLEEQADASSGADSAPVARKFLLAEDDHDIAALLELLLSEHGVDVTRAENGEQAIDAVRKDRYDMILMDLHMPVIDGYEATRQIRADGITTPVLVMTASAIEEDRSRAEQAGCDGYLVKPVVVEELLELADELEKNVKSGQDRMATDE